MSKIQTPVGYPQALTERRCIHCDSLLLWDLLEEPLHYYADCCDETYTLRPLVMVFEVEEEG